MGKKASFGSYREGKPRCGGGERPLGNKSWGGGERDFPKTLRAKFRKNKKGRSKRVNEGKKIKSIGKGVKST